MSKTSSITTRRALQLLAVFVLMLTVLFVAIAPNLGASSVITAHDAWAYPFSKGMVGSAYMQLENTGGLSDSLTQITTDVSQASLHQTQINNNIAQMLPVPQLEIPARSVVEIAPGGYHIMLEDLQRDLLEGEMIQLTLSFTSGKQLTVDVLVGIPEDL